jgi:uncharacterized protein YybS (DUF2232 family)
VPGLNVLAAIAAVAGLILIIARLGYFRAILGSLLGLLVAQAIGSLTMEQSGALVYSTVYLITVLMPGFAMGAAARAFSSPIKTVWNGLLPILFMLVLAVAFFGSNEVSTTAMIGEFNAELVTAIDENPAFGGMLMELFNVEDQNIDQLLQRIDEFIMVLFRILPGTMLVVFLTVLILALVAAGYFGSQMGLMIPRFRPFCFWRASDWWLLPTAIGLALVIFAQINLWRYIGANILLVSGSVYSVAGLAVIEALLRRFSVPLAVRLILYVILTLMLAVSAVALAVLGLVDSRFNLRHISGNSDEDIVE